MNPSLIIYVDLIVHFDSMIRSEYLAKRGSSTDVKSKCMEEISLGHF